MGYFFDDLYFNRYLNVVFKIHSFKSLVAQSSFMFDLSLQINLSPWVMVYYWIAVNPNEIATSFGTTGSDI